MLKVLRDRKEHIKVRLAALASLQAASFSVVAFESCRSDFTATLRAVMDDPDAELRQRVLGLLMREKDGAAQKRLIAGLENPAKALVPPEKALQLLGYDPHADAYRLARKIVEDPPNETAKREALRLLGADSSARPVFEKILRDKNEAPEHRRISASALQAIAPDALQKHAREIVLDSSESEDLQAASLTAIAQFGDTAKVGGDDELMKRVARLRTCVIDESETDREAAAHQVRPVTSSCSSVGGGEGIDPAVSEDQFAALVDSIAKNGDAGALTSLLRESHAVYDQRSTAAIVRMRGWILLALAQIGLPPNALIFVLEELDAGHDGYLVAAAARALRSSTPRPEFAPFIIQAVGNMRYRDDAVAFDSYGAYATASDATTPIRELLITLAWLGPLARDIVPRLVELRAPGSGVSKKLLPDIDRAVEAIGRGPANPPGSDCCEWRSSLGSVLRWPFGERADSDAVRSVEFEDHNGTPVTYGQFFTGQPSIVAFFYTRCDNPQKCSLTVAKLARVQRQLVERGIADQVRTAAITYDPGFDLPSRLLAYGRGRQMLMDDGHRLLRATKGIEPLRAYFGLGVNFVESLVNRHRIEIYVLDAAGRIGASFSRIHWDEREVVDRAAAMLRDDNPGSAGAPVIASRRQRGSTRRPLWWRRLHPLVWRCFRSARSAG